MGDNSSLQPPACRLLSSRHLLFLGHDDRTINIVLGIIIIIIGVKALDLHPANVGSSPANIQRPTNNWFHQ